MADAFIILDSSSEAKKLTYLGYNDQSLSQKNKMKDKYYTFSCKRNLAALGLLFFLIFLVYSNTFQASWHFDDYPNIINNPLLHIRDLRPETLIQTFFSSPGGGLSQASKMYRPIPCLTFAFNWYLGKNNVTGYHIVNIVLHSMTGCILFLTILNLFKSPNLKNKYLGSEYFIALLTATLWAINPIQVQAVTYIVQRMASMAAMFYVLGIYFYIMGRISNIRLNKMLFYLGCFLSFVFALGSKENAATFPLALLLVETAFFQDLGHPQTRRVIYWAAGGAILFVIFLGTLIFMEKDPLSFLNGYKLRPFTLFERLLAEPRILVFYLNQIFYPVPNRLSLVHDVMTSSSLFEPWTTLPAILIIFFLVSVGLSQIRKRPIVAFGILFFFINHLIESTIIPLELIYEHRNYMPSLFLFFPVSVGLKWLIDYYYKRKQPMYLILVSFTILLFIGLGTSTYIRNMAWASEKSLWEDAMAKAPESPRPPHNLAWDHYEKIGHFDKAIELYKKALMLKSPVLIKDQALSLTNMAIIYYKKHEYEKAIKLCKRSIDINPQHEAARYNMILSFIKTGRWEEASKNAELLLSKKCNQVDYLNLRGFILLKQKIPDESLQYFRKVLKSAPNNKNAIFYTGVALSLMGEYKKAERFLRRAYQISPKKIIILFCLIENSLRAEEVLQSDRYLEILFALFNTNEISKALTEQPNDNMVVPISVELLAPVIAKKLKGISEEIDRFGILKINHLTKSEYKNE